MLEATTMTQIETSLGLAEGTLQEAIASDDAKTIEIPTGKFYDTDKHVIKTLEENETFLKNTRAEANTAGLEKGIKDMRNELGYSFEGKTLANLMKAHADKILKDAGTEPSAKIEELTGDLATLKGLNVGLQGTIDTMTSEGLLKDNQRKIDVNILASIKGELTLSKEQITTLFKSEYEVVEEEGKQLIKKGGVTLKNDLLDPLTLADIMPKFIEPFAKKVEGGAGGGDSSGEGKAGSLDAFVKEMENAGKPQGSEEFNLEMNKRIGDKTLSI